MQFLKKHYEKLVLSLVLLGLAVVAILLTFKVEGVKKELEEKGRRRITAKQEAVKATDLSTNEVALLRFAKPLLFDLAGSHNLANPDRWIKGKNGEVIKDVAGVGAGAKGLSVKSVNPLALSISFKQAAGEGDDWRYQFLVEKPYSKKVNERRASIISAKVGSKTQDNLFVLREIKGPKENPSELTIELVEGGIASVNLAKPFTKVMGYSVDLRHELEKKEFLGKRVDETFTLDNVVYKIVAITKDEVVVSDPSSKRTIIRAASLRP